MSAKASYFRLGLFVISGALLLVAGVVLLGAGEYFEERFQVETYFRESVQGLDVGAPVNFRGVPVGAIEEISFVGAVYARPDRIEFEELFSYVRVRFGLDLDAFPGLSRQEIRERLQSGIDAGLRVRLASSGLTGTAYLSGEILDAADNPILEPSWTPQHFYIPSAPSTFGAMLASMGDTLQNLAKVDLPQIGENLNALLVNTNREIEGIHIAEVRDRVLALLDDLRGSNARIQDLLGKPELGEAIDNGAEAIAAIGDLIDASKEDVAAAIANARSAASRIDALLADERIDAIVDGLEQTTSQLPPAVVQARRTLQTVNALLREEQQDLRILIQNLRTISEGLVQLSSEAQDNPSRILFGEPPPRGILGE